MVHGTVFVKIAEVISRQIPSFGPPSDCESENTPNTAKSVDRGRTESQFVAKQEFGDI
jgi:hypothetical protein